MPGLLVAASYEASPVGPYRELAVAVPARLGMRPGWCVVLSVVDSADARRAYRERWALPTELGRLRWSTSAARVMCSWLDGRVEVAASVAGRWRVPFALPGRSLQRRHDGPVVVPRWLWGWARAARVDVTVSVSDGVVGALGPVGRGDLSSLAGPHAGLLVSSLRVAASPARQPVGLLSSLHAPQTVGTAEPALTSLTP